jgi:uncharacterized protein YgbK (DUF1537 family)
MTTSENTVNSAELLAHFPSEIQVDPALVRQHTLTSAKCLVVIDDDPTGSQTVSGIPVITKWGIEDFDWALAQGTGAIFVLINSRAEDVETAVNLNTLAVTNALASAKKLGIELSFVSRSDSTLRGHFPAETDAIAAALKANGQPGNAAILMIPAFPRAGRVTVGGVHYLRVGEQLVPAAKTEFAKDASFGFKNSILANYVEEKTQGRVKSSEVHNISLNTIRSTPEQISKELLALPAGSISSVDAVTENDLRQFCLGVAQAESEGASFLFRTGPTFVGAWIGQKDYAPLDQEELHGSAHSDAKGGLIVIGSHVAQTNLQLEQVRLANPNIREVEISPEMALHRTFFEVEANDIVDELLEILKTQNVILRTSRKLVTGTTAEESLAISRKISDAVSTIVNRLLKKSPPRFVIAKGGITSNDVASKGLEVSHAIAVGPLLPGIVSLWRPIDGVAVGMPFVVFPGNVGDEKALAEVVARLSSANEKST